MRLRVDTEEGRGGADALPESEVQKPQMEYIGVDGRIYRLVYAGWQKIGTKIYPVFAKEEAESERAVKGDEGEGLGKASVPGGPER